MKYIGRFAPSPTGPLHAGSLVSALASWVDARAHKGDWLLRIEDIDPPREVAGASDEIIKSLAAHGLQWDGEIIYQSQRSDYYDRALQTLRNHNMLYACTCTRKHLREIAVQKNTTAYPGTCRNLALPEDDYALRLKVTADPVSFIDSVVGKRQEDVANTTGDFIVRRRGPLYAYQLAVVVDDAMQGVTHVVRGTDLLDNTARQIKLQQMLEYQTPAYCHIPLVLSDDGRKLSKQTGAAALDSSRAVQNLHEAWSCLGQPPVSIKTSPAAFLEAAIPHWRRDRIPAVEN